MPPLPGVAFLAAHWPLELGVRVTAPAFAMYSADKTANMIQSYSERVPDRPIYSIVPSSNSLYRVERSLVQLSSLVHVFAHQEQVLPRQRARHVLGTRHRRGLARTSVRRCPSVLLLPSFHSEQPVDSELIHGVIRTGFLNKVEGKV